MAAEENLKNSLFKIELFLLKILPMLLAFCNLLNTILSYFYDDVYVANMCKADFYGSSITDEMHLAKYVKDVIDDDDAYDGIVFNMWYADMCYTGIAIDWEDML